MFTFVYSTIVFLLGVSIGAAGLFLLHKRKNGFSAAQIQVTANFALALSVIVAMAALLVSLNVGMEQSDQQKRQYTRDFLAQQLTPTRMLLFQNLTNFIILGQMYDVETDLNTKKPGSVGPSIWIDGQQINFADFPIQLERRAIELENQSGEAFTYLNSIKSCIDQDICERDIALPVLCGGINEFHEFEKTLSHGSATFNALEDIYLHSDPRSYAARPSIIGATIQIELNFHNMLCPEKAAREYGF